MPHPDDVFAAFVRANRPRLVATALAALEAVGVLGRLEGGVGVEALASGGLVAHRVEAVLNALAVEGEVERVEGGYRRRPGRPRPSAAALEGGGWGRLAAALRGAAPERPEGREAVERHHAHLKAVAGDVAPAMWGKLGLAGGRLLDLGGGFGGYAWAWVELTGGEAVVVDRREVVEAAPPVEGVRFVAGEIDGAEVGEAEVVLLANVAHLYGPARAAGLVAASAARVAAGGALVVKDLALGEGGGPPEAAWFAVNMAVFTEAGRVYRRAEVQAWMEAAGLAVEVVPVGGALVWVGRRAGVEAG